MAGEADINREAPRAQFGPFHRLKSPTQSTELALEQRRSGELWGTVPFGSGWPQVQAYREELPDDQSGIEFYTRVPPDDGDPRKEVRWDGRRGDVRTDGHFAIIECVVVRIIDDGRAL